jgi:hypothetical protein
LDFCYFVQDFSVFLFYFSSKRRNPHRGILRLSFCYWEVQRTGGIQGGREGGLVVSLKKEKEGNGAQEKG